MEEGSSIMQVTKGKRRHHLQRLFRRFTINGVRRRQQPPPASIPSQATQPIVARYVYHWYGRSINQCSDFKKEVVDNEFRLNGTPLMEAMYFDDEASIFMILNHNKLLLQTPAAPPSLNNDGGHLSKSLAVTSSSSSDATAGDTNNCNHDDDSNNNYDMIFDINATNGDGLTALHFAIKYSKLQFCKLLLKHGADPNRNADKHGTPLLLLMEMEYEEQVCRRSHACFSRSQLRTEIANMMIEYGGDVNIGTLKRCYWFCRNQIQTTPLVIAVALLKNCDLTRLFLNTASTENVICSLLLMSVFHGDPDYSNLDVKHELAKHLLSKFKSNVEMHQVLGKWINHMVISHCTTKNATKKDLNSVSSRILQCLNNGIDYLTVIGDLHHEYFARFTSHQQSNEHQQYTLLHYAARYNLKIVVDWIITNRNGCVDTGYNPQYRNARTPLHEALRGIVRTFDHDELLERLGICKTLIQQGANINAKDDRGYTPLHYACCVVSDSDIWFYRRPEGANNIIKRDNILASFVAFLLSIGADVNAICDYDNCCDRERSLDRTPLLTATLHLSPSHRSPYYFNKSLLVKRLLEAGADFNARDQNGASAVHYIAGSHLIDCMSFIIHSGRIRNIHSKDNSYCTPLLYAVKLGSYEMTESLLRHTEASKDMNINHERHDGTYYCGTTGIDMIPLLVAVEQDSIKKVKLLLEHGANMSYTNIHGQEEISVVKYAKSYEILKLLDDYGADKILVEGQKDKIDSDEKVLKIFSDGEQVIKRRKSRWWWRKKIH